MYAWVSVCTCVYVCAHTYNTCQDTCVEIGISYGGLFSPSARGLRVWTQVTRCSGKHTHPAESSRESRVPSSNTVCLDQSAGADYHTVTHSLCFARLWASIMVSVCHKEKCISWGVITTLSVGNRVGGGFPKIHDLTGPEKLTEFWFPSCSVGNPVYCYYIPIYYTQHIIKLCIIHNI